MGASKDLFKTNAAPKIIIICGIMDGIIRRALSPAAMSVKSPIFQPWRSYTALSLSLSFLLTVTQNRNDFSFHYQLSVFHLGRMMIDFHSSPILPYRGLLTPGDTMQNARRSAAYADSLKEEARSPGKLGFFFGAKMGSLNPLAANV